MYQSSLVIDASPLEPLSSELGWLPASLSLHPPRWRQAIGPAVSATMLIAVITQMRSLDFPHIWSVLPLSPAFWLAMAAAYFLLPVSEWLIYRRLWRLPVTGIIPLLRKRISNEIVLGYSGELYFYAWARRNGDLAATPFGAIKDVSILSAQVGNIVTLALLAVAWPFFGFLHLGTHGREILFSCAAVVGLSLPVMLFRHHLFTLPANELRRIAAIHFIRVIGTLFSTAVAWHVAEPTVMLTWWIVLVALRQLLSRLPLLPNKDIAFAAVAVYLIAGHVDLATIVAMTASVVLCAHLLFGSGLAVADLTVAATR